MVSTCIHDTQIPTRTNEYNSGELILDPDKNPYVFPALIVSNTFATIAYDAHVITKI